MFRGVRIFCSDFFFGSIEFKAVWSLVAVSIASSFMVKG